MKRLIIAAIIAGTIFTTACSLPINLGGIFDKSTEQEADAPKEKKDSVVTAIFDSKAIYGEWSGTYMIREYDDDLNEVETDEEAAVLLEIKDDGTWVATYEDRTVGGPWEKITTSGRAIKLLIDHDTQDEPADRGWTFTCGIKNVLHFNNWVPYDVEMTKL